jgi:hypothetical protein
MSQVKERPILFSAPMVRAILEGRKTVTRRAVKFPFIDRAVGCELSGNEIGLEEIRNNCPYGVPGQRLWVRETFGLQVRHYGGGTGQHIVYRATNPDAIYCKSAEGQEYPVKWKPSIHMPRHSSRILLEVTDVRVERLQDITYEQAAAEGVHRGPLREWCASDEGGACYKYPIPAFRDLWQSVGGNWDANPWVWVVEFKRVTP